MIGILRITDSECSRSAFAICICAVKCKVNKGFKQADISTCRPVTGLTMTEKTYSQEKWLKLKDCSDWLRKGKDRKSRAQVWRVKNRLALKIWESVLSNHMQEKA